MMMENTCNDATLLNHVAFAQALSRQLHHIHCIYTCHYINNTIKYSIKSRWYIHADWTSKPKAKSNGKG